MNRNEPEWDRNETGMNRNETGMDRNETGMNRNEPEWDRNGLKWDLEMLLYIFFRGGWGTKLLSQECFWLFPMLYLLGTPWIGKWPPQGSVRGGVISILIIYVPPKIIHFPPRINYSSYFQQHVRQWRRTAYCAEYRGKIWWDSWGKWRVSFRIVRTVMKIIISML